MNLAHRALHGLSMVTLAVLSGCGAGNEEGSNEVPGESALPATGTTFHLPALASGNWSSAGVHNVGNYQIGHSVELPNQQAAYFEFNLDPVKGRTLVSANLLIPGSNDFNIEVVYTPKCPGTNVPCFKIGIAPQGNLTLDEIVSPSSNHNTNVFLNAADTNRNQDLGYFWVEDGLHKGVTFDAGHYHPERLQQEMNAGGNWVFWAADRFDTGESNRSNGVCPACPGGFENYVWGSTSFTSAIVLDITVE
jgi:hypothetical protein